MDPLKFIFEFYEEVPDAALLKISGSDVELLVRHIRGAGGLGVEYKKFLKDWCTHFHSKSEHIWAELSH